jgi:hypothetical protein
MVGIRPESIKDVMIVDLTLAMLQDICTWKTFGIFANASRNCGFANELV